MIDFAKITVKGGKGGNGAGSFRSVKGKRRGKADGGDGGTGGNVFVEATLDLNTLEPFRFVKNYKAQDGQMGFSNLRRGANGRDLVLKVPMGTEIRIEAGPVSGFPPASAQSSPPSQPSQSSEPESLRAVKEAPFSRAIVATRKISTYDLVAEGEKVMVARGGGGGRGNAKLRDEFGRRPKRGEAGAVGEMCNMTLELKLIADAGLIGLPNAGKSTLLAALTAARPQIASYPFTTLEPNLGVLESSQFTLRQTQGDTEHGRSITVRSSRKGRGKISETDNREPLTVNKSAKLILADIPGLIEGAAEGRGLGDLFLRHIERTKILIHLIDVSASGDHWQDYQTIRAELKTYSKDLVKKREIIVLNKIDSASPPEVSEIRQLFAKKRKKVFAISALNKEGLEELVKEILRLLNPKS